MWKFRHRWVRVLGVLVGTVTLLAHGFALEFFLGFAQWVAITGGSHLSRDVQDWFILLGHLGGVVLYPLAILALLRGHARSSKRAFHGSFVASGR